LVVTTAGAFLGRIEAQPLIEGDGLLVYDPPATAAHGIAAVHYEVEDPMLGFRRV
jgi:hypothetical protein